MRKISAGLLAIAMLLATSACGRGSATSVQESSQIEAELTETEVEPPADVYRVTFSRDESTLELLAQELITSQYEQYSEEDEPIRQWMGLRNGEYEACFSLSDRWVCGYLNRARDKNGNHMESNHMIEYGYITEVIPAGLSITAADAGDIVKAFAESHSDCFTFTPYRVLAEDPAEGEQSGFYTVFALREEEREPVDSVVPSETVLQKFQAHENELTGAEYVEVEGIELEYFVQAEDNGYLIVPVWAVLGTVCFDYENDDTELSFSALYYAEDGILCDVYYPGL